MKKHNLFLTLVILLTGFNLQAQIDPTLSPFYSDGPYSVTADSSTVNSTKVVMYHPITAPAGNKFPVFIFQPGANGLFGGEITVHSYDIYLKHLASYGYVVLVIDETTAGLPDGTTFKAVHDWFKITAVNTTHWLFTYADPSKVAIGGHSNGGVNATACLIDRPSEIGAIIYFASYPSNNWLMPQDVSGYSGRVLDLAGADDATSTPEDCRQGYDSFAAAACSNWVLISGMDHGGFGDYENSSQPIGSIGRDDATATIRHFLVSYLESEFKNSTLAQESFQNASLQPNTIAEFESTCTTTTIQENEINTGCCIYPNPVSTNTFLKTNAGIFREDLFITDLSGKNITNEIMISPVFGSVFTLDFSSVESGIYLINYNNSSNKSLLVSVIH